MNDAKKKNLTQHELRAELDARKLRLDQHLSGLQSELTVADVNVGGRPILDYVREKPLVVAGVAAGVGMLAGLVTGLMKREAPEPPSERDLWMSAYLNDLLDESAHRVQRGEDSDAALRHSLRRRAPVVVLEAEEQPVIRKQSTVGRVLLNTALGFGVKFALDQLAQQVTGEEELFEAMESEATSEPVSSPPPPAVTPIEPTYQ
jgi:ElaB/YqjD/DUF883 family membrane-anchored ribosome-binding protein